MAEASGSKELPGWIKDHLDRYIATNGEDGYLWDASLGGGKGMIPTLLLTTTGRKSGRELTLPPIFGQSGSDYVVVASKGGAPAHPAWYLNLDAEPKVHVQVKADKFTARRFFYKRSVLGKAAEMIRRHLFAAISHLRIGGNRAPEALAVASSSVRPR